MLYLRPASFAISKTIKALWSGMLVACQEELACLSIQSNTIGNSFVEPGRGRNCNYPHLKLRRVWRPPLAFADQLTREDTDQLFMEGTRWMMSDQLRTGLYVYLCSEHTTWLLTIWSLQSKTVCVMMWSKHGISASFPVRYDSRKAIRGFSFCSPNLRIAMQSSDCQCNPRIAFII
jgi:hypothetical protein